jgi:hypothetical protein
MVKLLYEEIEKILNTRYAKRFFWKIAPEEVEYPFITMFPIGEIDEELTTGKYAISHVRLGFVAIDTTVGGALLLSDEIEKLFLKRKFTFGSHRCIMTYRENREIRREESVSRKGFIVWYVSVGVRFVITRNMED